MPVTVSCWPADRILLLLPGTLYGTAKSLPGWLSAAVSAPTLLRMSLHACHAARCIALIRAGMREPKEAGLRVD